MKEIKLIANCLATDFPDRLKEALQNATQLNWNIIDIKFSMAYDKNNVDYYSAMIIYSRE